MKKRIILGALILSLSCLCAPADAVSSRTLHKKLAAVDEAHPRLFFSESEEAALKARIQRDPLLTKTFEYLIACTEQLSSQPLLKREKEGKRLLGVSRTCLQRVSFLAFAYRMTRQEAYLKRAQEEMLACAAFTDWNPSHFLDVAEMTAALAIGYDWLYNELDPEARTTIQEAILDKGLRTSCKGGWWVSTTNNWNQVCHGGLIVGALATLENDPALAEKIIQRGLEKLPLAMHEYEPDGVYPEGPSYWKYGTSYNVLLIAALESVLGDAFGLAKKKGFMKSPLFFLHATGPTGQFYNFSDCGSSGGIAPAMYWFAQRQQDRSLLWREKDALKTYVDQNISSSGAADRFLAFLLIWAQPFNEIPTPKRTSFQGDGRTPIAMHRSAWTPEATYLGVKGGCPASNHAHMDIGSFVLDMQGVRWAIDLGAQSYHSLESKGVDLWNRSQESERWTVFRLNTFSHNTLVVNGEAQRVKGEAPILRSKENIPQPFTIVDMTPVYEGQLNKAHRGVRLFDGAVLIQDDVETPDQPATIRWGMATNAEVSLGEGPTALLQQAGKQLYLTVVAPEAAHLKLIDMEQPPQPYDATNKNTRMIAFEVEAPAKSEASLMVWIASKPGSTPPQQEALTAWKR